jgi:hypothetical protein
LRVGVQDVLDAVQCPAPPKREVAAVFIPQHTFLAF